MLDTQGKPPKNPGVSASGRGLGGKADPPVYVFAFTRQTLMLVCTGFTAAGVLLFFAGLLLGVSVRLPDGSLQARKPDGQVAAAVEPPGSTSAPLLQAQRPAIPRSVPDQPIREPALELSPPQPEKSVPEEPPQEEMPTTIQREPDRQIALVLPADPRSTDAPPATESPPARPMAFSVQVGAFLFAKEADALLKDLTGKGYAPYIVRVWGVWRGEKRLWHIVRIGDYAHREEASRMAAEFKRTEQMPALVRRIDAPSMAAGRPARRTQVDPPPSHARKAALAEDPRTAELAARGRETERTIASTPTARPVLREASTARASQSTP